MGSRECHRAFVGVEQRMPRAGIVGREEGATLRKLVVHLDPCAIVAEAQPDYSSGPSNERVICGNNAHALAVFESAHLVVSPRDRIAAVTASPALTQYSYRIVLLSSTSSAAFKQFSRSALTAAST